MRELLSQARKRVVGHLVLDKGALALTIGLAGVVVLLLAGTQILDWYWPVALAGLSLGVGVWQVRKHVPSVYQIAQRIDHKLSLADSLSTAAYFAENPKPGFEAVCAEQLKSADALASGVNLKQALPLTRSRYLLPAAALLVAASGLFVTRYLMTGSLDLSGSMFDMVVDTFFATPAQELAAQAKRPNFNFRSNDPASPDEPADEALKDQPPPDAEKGSELKNGDDTSSNGDAKQESGDEQESQDQQKGDGEESSKQQDKQGDQKESGDDKGKSESQGNDQRSVMDKLRDAVNNLMAKMNPESQQKQAQKGGQKQQGKKQDKGEKGEKGDKGKDDAQSESNDPGDAGDPKDAKQSNAPGQKTSEDAKNGAGQDDGKKDIENAKALQAMGAISELLGERSTGINGEVMVEVGNTKQQLKTALTQQSAGHTDAGGEIHRDQVPLAYQTFVEKYFQEVRRTSK